MGYRNRKGALRSLAMYILLYLEGALSAIRAAIAAGLDGLRAATNPERAKQDFDEMNEK